MIGIASIADLLALESEPDSLLANCAYEMIGAAARGHPDVPALSYFPRVTATANFLHELGVGADDVVAFALPNLSQTHLAVWGGQTADMAFAINPLLKPAAVVELLALTKRRC